MSEAVRLEIVGVGRVGSFWLRAACACGIPARGWELDPLLCPEDLRPVVAGIEGTSRAGAFADAEVVLLCTGEPELAAACESIAEAAGLDRGGRGPVIAHTSGSLGPETLHDAGVPAARAASAHPVYPFAARDSSPPPTAVVHALDGPPDAVAALARLIEASGGRWLHLRVDSRPLYHLACVLAANHVVTLAHLAQQLASRAGGRGPETDAAARGPAPSATLGDALTGLMAASVENLRLAGDPAAALSGPVLRGDLDTLRGHEAALEAHAPELLPLYRELVHATLPLVPEEAALTLAPFLSPRDRGL